MSRAKVMHLPLLQVMRLPPWGDLAHGFMPLLCFGILKLGC